MPIIQIGLVDFLNLVAGIVCLIVVYDFYHTGRRQYFRSSNTLLFWGYLLDVSMFCLTLYFSITVEGWARGCYIVGACGWLALLIHTATRNIVMDKTDFN